MNWQERFKRVTVRESASLRGMVERDYFEAVRLAVDIPEGLRQALVRHERTPKLINNVIAEIAQIEAKGLPLDRELIKRITYDFTNIFMRLVKQRADEQAMSDLAKSAMVQKQKELEAIDKALDASGNGEIDGIKVQDNKARENKPRSADTL